MKESLILLVFASVVALLALDASGQGFQDPFLDPANTLESHTANVGGGQAAPIDPFAAQQAPGVGQAEPFAGDPFNDVSNAFQPFAGGAGGNVAATPLANRIRVVRGQWIRDAVTGELLSAPELTSDLESNKINYSNDGQTMGDVLAEDEIYSNVSANDGSFIGPNTHTFILWKINMLKLLHDMDPLSFKAVLVASPDPVSPLPLYDDFEAHQDSKIEEWNERFLQDFRVPDPVTGTISPDGEFYPIFVPSPPYSEPIRPNPNLAPPPADFLTQAWIGFQGGQMDANQVLSVRNTAQQQQGGFGAPGVGGEGLIGGSAGSEWQGQSGYFGEQNNAAAAELR